MSDKDSKGELKPPKRIYLTWFNDCHEPATAIDEDICWCEDQINDGDPEYRLVTPKEEWISVEVNQPECENHLDRVLALVHHPRLDKVKGVDSIFMEEAYCCKGKWYDWSADGISIEESESEVIFWRFKPSPPTDQTEKECENPDCENGRYLFIENTAKGDVELWKICPDCQKDQTIQEERNHNEI